jgi:MFS family permease
MPYTQSLNLVILVNGVGFPARILPGYLADRYLGALNTFIICILLNAIIFWAWLGVSSIPGYYVFITLYGLFAAAFQSLLSTTVAALSSDITKTGTMLGMTFSTLGISALVAGPMSGAMVGGSGGFTVPICWAAGSTCVGVGLCVWARAIKYGWGFRVKC